MPELHPHDPPIVHDRAFNKDLVKNLVIFCRLLRQKGVLIGIQEELDSIRSLEMISVDDQDSFYLCLRTILAKSLREQEIFDKEFKSFWHIWVPASLREKAEKPEIEQKPKPTRKKKENFITIKDWLNASKQPDESKDVASYSDESSLLQKDFSLFYGMETDELENWIKLFGKSLVNRLGRRYIISSNKGKVDLRSSLRKNLRKNTEVINLYRKRRKPQKLKLVILTDVSKSMDLYSRFVLQFLYAFQKAFRKVNTFIFSNRLKYVSPLLDQMELNHALDQLTNNTEEWSGGTQIGKCFQEFLEHDQSKNLSKDSIVIVISDGWDTGNLVGLEDAMFQIQQKAKSVIWLNPLKGYHDYQPTCQGMLTALPYIDYFGSAHNLESMKELASEISSQL